jgi:hypothetical protein
MKKIGIEVNGVLRNTLGKIQQTYEKFLIENNSTEKTYILDESGNTESIIQEEEFEYEVLGNIDSLNLLNHFKFKSDDELYEFLYQEFAMQIFGHAESSEMHTFHTLNDIYLKYRSTNDIVIISDEIGKSKPATLFFLSKFGCQIEKIKFYSDTTKNSIWDEVDVLVSANPSLIEDHPENKVVIKFNTQYNKTNKSEHEISSLKELDECLQKLGIC